MDAMRVFSGVNSVYYGRRIVGLPLIISLFLLTLGTSAIFGASSDGSEVEQALKLYRHTDFSGAIEILQPLAKTDAAASALMGQSYYMLGEYAKSTESLERAVALDSSKSSYYVWLGRVYGRRAETSFPLIAPRYASKARSSFEKALELNPSDPEATDDLFEFYLQAPGFLGGGFDKAARLAEKIGQRDPAEGVFAKARIAEERKDYSTAEAMLRRAIELAPHQPGRLVELAKFLAKRGRYEESDATFAQARKFAPDAPRVLFHEAATYIRANRKPEESRELLKRYISSSITEDDPSKKEAQALLKKVSGS
jgi:tetratricopeptide (TPR) repeat protein